MNEDRIDLGDGIYAGPMNEQDWRTIYRKGDKPGRRIGHMEDDAVQAWRAARPSEAFRAAAERCAYLLDLRADKNDTAGLEAAETMRALLAAEGAP